MTEAVAVRPIADETSLLQRRRRTHAIVEGALLGDIAIVFLLMRVYLPVPIVRTLLRALAAVPFVMLTQRRGIKLTVLASIASYILFSALVGPILALTAVDIAISGLLVGIGRRRGQGVGLVTLWTGVVYSVLDLIIPTIASVIIFQYPVSKLVQSARHLVRLIFKGLIFVVQKIGAPHSAVNLVRGWEPGAVDHWQIMWLGITVLVGILNMYLVALVAEMVLKQVPEGTLARQDAIA
jgi:uncharacterized protein YybS (DUF2232 family)